MTRAELQSVLVRELSRIAPEASLETLSPEADLRDALDLDSMDLLTLVGRLEQSLHLRVPEADTRELRTLRSSVEYLARRTQAS